MKKPKTKKKKPVGRPAQNFDAVVRVLCTKKMREEFLLLCNLNKPRCSMNAAIRHFMKLCIVNKTVLGLDVDE